MRYHKLTFFLFSKYCFLEREKNTYTFMVVYLVKSAYRYYLWHAIATTQGTYVSYCMSKLYFVRYDESDKIMNDTVIMKYSEDLRTF